jgi:hypothetical protein
MADEEFSYNDAAANANRQLHDMEAVFLGVLADEQARNKRERRRQQAEHRASVSVDTMKTSLIVDEKALALLVTASMHAAHHDCEWGKDWLITQMDAIVAAAADQALRRGWAVFDGHPYAPNCDDTPTTEEGE